MHQSVNITHFNVKIILILLLYFHINVKEFWEFLVRYENYQYFVPIFLKDPLIYTDCLTECFS